MAKIALITGGNSGIGKATAAVFAKHGYSLAIAARRQEMLAQVEQELSLTGSEILSIPTDVSQAAEVEQLVQTVIQKWGRIDVLVHAAGVLESGTILDTEEASWDRIIDINLKGTYLVNRAVVRQMVSQGSGSIVNVASDAGMMGARNLAVYAASKGGVVLLTRSMALDHIRQGVRINALCPGPVATPMVEDISPEEMKVWQQFLPIQRFATPLEIAEAAYFLAHSEYMVGSCLTIDGGNTAGGAI